MSLKSQFPIFQNNPGLVYLDNAASTQKPQMVIDGVSDFVSHNYSNIHRWLYQISENAEDLYELSKTQLAQFIHAQAKEIIYTYNSTYAFNLLIQALVKSKKIWKGDKVLLGIREHHSNVLAWQSFSQEIGFEVDFIGLDEDTWLDWQDFQQKYTENVKVVSVSQVSNVTGTIIDVEKLHSLLREDTFFIVDGSQSVPHFPVDVQKIWCDAMIMTGHKMMAYSGLGMLYLKYQRIKELEPMILWGGTVKDVSVGEYSLQKNSMKREAGTPNIIGAVSLLKALEWIEQYGGIEKMWAEEQNLVAFLWEQFQKRKEKIWLLWTKIPEHRVGVFSFTKLTGNTNFNQIWESFAKENICVRVGGHCAYPLHKFLQVWGTIRLSTYVYNDFSDGEKFFEVLDAME